MNRINQLFESGRRNLLSIYFCAGTPRLDGTMDTLKALQSHGVDMVEIGIPFSDPMADGPVIQDAATRALRNGMSLKLLFDQLHDVRKKSIDMPLILMGYLNPVMQYGFERFCRSCSECGIDGAIIPDLPFREYMESYKGVADKYGVRIIMLITPETSDERIRLIDEHTDGFIYMVSSASTTGAQNSFGEQKQAYFKRIADLNLKHNCMVGFGISNRQTFESACANAAGGIIGSKFVTLLEQEADADVAIEKLVEAINDTK